MRGGGPGRAPGIGRLRSAGGPAGQLRDRCRSNPLSSLPLPAAPQSLLPPPPAPQLRHCPEAMDPPTPPPAAAPSPPRHYLLIDTRGVPYKYTAQVEHERRAPPPPPEELTPGEGYDCPECGRVWRTIGQLRHHLVVHSPFKPYVCNVCGRGFKRTNNLYKHRREVHGAPARARSDRPYACGLCSRRFQDEVALAEHENQH
ncbi:zinc finger protein 580-like isoform X1 [Choloepus didactylus]|uniref:zinc finger protein 580-like isoform X1 n=2 Tax=Choloepus didactylus TaxID=27675 RepID=UPI00189FB00A|nr:zinc finger protein 580-like isoform X1 [Choloepus didactylus]